jgi:uncharacterized membrane protein YgcG
MISHNSGNGRMLHTMLLRPEQEKRSVDVYGWAGPHPVVTGAYQEVHVQDWKRKILKAGVSLSVVGGGVLLAQGSATAHDAVDHGGPAHHEMFRHQVKGVVASVGTGTFTITTHRGTTETIATTSATVFSETGTPVVPATVAVGQNVAVSLDPTNPIPTAQRVVIVLNRISGEVHDVSATSFTLSGHNTTRVVMVSSGTMFFNGTTSATGVTVGEFVTAFGNADPTTRHAFDALFVDIGFAHPQPAGTPAVPPTVPNPNPGVGHRDDHGDNDNDGDNDANEHANGNGNDANDHATTTTTGVPAAPVTPAPGGQGPSTDGGQGGSGDGGGGSSGGGTSGSHGGRG